MTWDIFNYKPLAAVRIEVPRVGDLKSAPVVIEPPVISAKWTRNNHLVADELTITIGWEEGGADPRFLKNSTCEFYMWDSLRQDFKDYDRRFLRFLGICTKATRKLGAETSEVTLTYHDYTTLFINMKPFPSSGMPEYSDSLAQIWDKICDHTGFKDPGGAKETNGQTKIISSVAKLRGLAPSGGLVISPGVDARTLGAIVNKRFLKISKPSPPKDANAWQVWQWCCESLGYVTYIQEDKCMLMTTTEHYDPSDAPGLIYGQNILEFEEESDTAMSGKGILLKSFDPLTFRTLESAWPPPGDESLKITRAVAARALKEGRTLGINDISGDYMEFNYFSIQTQEALDYRCKEAYEEWSRQQMTGTLKTSEMALEGPNGEIIDTLGLFANDPISIGIDPDIQSFKTEEEARKYLIDIKHYTPRLASIVSQNLGNKELQDPTFHVTSMDVEYHDGTCMIEIKYHNLVHAVSGSVKEVPLASIT